MFILPQVFVTPLAVAGVTEAGHWSGPSCCLAYEKPAAAAAAAVGAEAAVGADAAVGVAAAAPAVAAAVVWL